MSARPAAAPNALPDPVTNASTKNGQTRSAPVERDAQERREDDDVHDDHEGVDAPPGEAIRDMPGGKGEQEEWKELREPDEPEIEGILADRVDLPADGHGRHRHGEAGRDQRDPEQREVAVPQRGSALAVHSGSLGRHRPRPRGERSQNARTPACGAGGSPHDGSGLGCGGRCPSPRGGQSPSGSGSVTPSKPAMPKSNARAGEVPSIGAEQCPVRPDEATPPRARRSASRRPRRTRPRAS